MRRFSLCFLAFVALTITSGISAADSPNIVLILSDDQAWTDYGFMGHPDIKTPHLDELAKESVVFPRGYVPTALCRPSLMTLITHGMTRGFPQRGGRHGDDGLKIGRAGMEPVTSFVDEAVKQDKPFFLWYAPFLPHTPHNPPERILARYRKDGRPITIAKYYAMCEWFDETCGQLIDHLEEKGVRENTLIVYVCDNGWIQNPEANGYAPRSKQTPYEGGIRTPIMYSWPGHLKSGIREEVVSSIDIVPTMLAAGGADIPKDLPGLNLLSNLGTGTRIDRDAIFGESFAHDIADIEDPEASLLFRWCIQGRWKLLLTYDGEVNRYQSTHPRTEKRPQLFDLLADPAEKKNLAADNPEIVARLAEKISDWYPVKKRKVLTKFE